LLGSRDGGVEGQKNVLSQITPVLLTYNEDANIERTLSHLVWAKDIVVVDSGSTDGTLALLANFPAVRVFNRPFDTHANQWRYAVEETQIATDWILRLDADYQLSDALVAELGQLDSSKAVSAYRIGFDYAIFSRTLLSSLYPANTILLRRGCFSIRDKGHTEAWDVKGPVSTLKARIIHDDWKPTGQWQIGQVRYMERELDRLRVDKAGLTRWLRLTPPLMPIAVFLYCLFGKGLILDGRAGIFYALQRMVAEAVLSLMVLEEKLRARVSRSGPVRVEERRRQLS
jgi:glycosyltransferase involved in cell wall biosynthesis